MIDTRVERPVFMCGTPGRYEAAPVSIPAVCDSTVFDFFASAMYTVERKTTEGG